MVRYRFYGNFLNMTAQDLLNELKNKGYDVSGCLVTNYYVEIYFNTDPANTVIQDIAQYLNSNKYNKIEDIQEEYMF